MEQLKRKRQSLKGSITRLQTYANNNISASTEEYRVRLDRLEQVFKEYESIQDEIDANSDTIEVDEAYRSELESVYYLVKATYLVRLRDDDIDRTVIEAASPNHNLSTAVHTLVEHQTTMSQLIEQMTTNASLGINSPTSNGGVNIQSQQHEIRLPQIQLPEFDGTYTNWLRFRDLFETLIHTRQNLADVEKFEYLQSKLKGDALSLIKHLKLSNDNYSVAWEILKNKFENSEQVKKAYFELLFEQSPMKYATVMEAKRIYNSSNEVVNALKALKEPVEQWDSILLFHIEKKLDSETHILWYREKKHKERHTFQSLLDFLEKRIFELENASKNIMPSFKTKRYAEQNEFTRRNRNSQAYASAIQICPVCKENHHLYNCDDFKKLDIDNRYTVLRNNNMCFNCMFTGHRVQDCTKSTCKHCNKKHNTLLHRTQGKFNFQQHPSHQQKENQSKSINVNSAHQFQNSFILLPTAKIMIADSHNIWQPCRALLDSGAQATLITEACAQRLHLRRYHDKILMHGVGISTPNYTKGKVTLNITSYSKNKYLTTEAYCLPKLTQLIPGYEFRSNKLGFFKGLKLADTHFDKPGEIDVILGADIFMSIAMGDKIVHPTGTPTAFKTMFGWVLIGNVGDAKDNGVTVAHTCIDLNKQLQTFWELEEVPNIVIKRTPDEEEAEAHFQKTYERNKDGRYMVRLPFKQSTAEFGDSKSAAVKRFNGLERRFSQNTYLFKQYNKFIEEYIELGHMELAKDSPVNRTFFMPHHAIIKPTSSTTKLRVVFDGSCKSTNGISLNDRLLVGPTLQNDIFTLLLQFRKYKIGMCSDIEKMYRQILIHPDDRSYQSIVWRNSKEEPLKQYHLNTVTYGTSAAPYLAIRTLHQIALDNENKFPNTANAIQNNFYVDDFMFCTQTLQEAITMKNEMCAVLSQAGLYLRKWASNSQKLMDTIKIEDRDESTNAIIDDTHTVKTLGLFWDTTNDVFRYKVSLTTLPATITKRIILSEIAKIFDPIGWLSPVVVSLKILLQKLWLRRMDWDQKVPDDLANQWINMQQGIKNISTLHIPRWIKYQKGQHVELHGFSDSSELAYAAAIYIKIQYDNGAIETHLVAAKTRVTPIKQLTLPRLELCAAQLMAKLIKKVQNALIFENVTCFGWTDSTIVLAWLSDHPRRWKTFIANRTSYIIEIIPADYWCHVQSQQNPADLATRGVHPDEILNNQLWWQGPEILKKPISMVPPLVKIADNLNMEERKEFMTHTTAFVEKEFIQRYSNYNKLLRLTAMLLRFKGNCLAKKLHLERQTRSLNTDELQTAHNVLIRMAQLTSHEKEIEILLSKKQLPSCHKLAALLPFVDASGIMRVGGRIENSIVSYNQKHPIILSKHHHLTELIIRNYHQRYLHAGSRHLQYLIGLKYWIPGVSHAIKRCVFKCPKCMRFRHKPYEQQMGNLPQCRLQPAATFISVGIDFAGPMQVRSWKGRGSKLYKCWISLFVCLVTKAIHLDLVTELSSAAFIATLRRFISRRGKPANVYSDNGTNFVGCNQYLRELYQLLNQQSTQDAINSELASQEIKWHFAPPSGPHFGGLWEAGVKSTKFHLRRVLSNTSVTYEEFYTTLCQIEGCLNSRPLCLKFEGDTDPLTPAHFLIMRPLTAIPSDNSVNQKQNFLNRWKYLQRLVDEFWNRWSKEYLGQLQRRPKWIQKQNNLKINDVVILKEDNLPPTQWAIGKIEKVHPGNDGAVRVVTVKTAKGQYKRPIARLCPLFLDI